MVTGRRPGTTVSPLTAEACGPGFHAQRAPARARSRPEAVELDRPGWWVARRALLSLFMRSMTDFQVLLIWSNRADSLGSCLRMSSPRKIF